MKKILFIALLPFATTVHCMVKTQKPTLVSLSKDGDHLWNLMLFAQDGSTLAEEKHASNATSIQATLENTLLHISKEEHEVRRLFALRTGKSLESLYHAYTKYFNRVCAGIVERWEALPHAIKHLIATEITKRRISNFNLMDMFTNPEKFLKNMEENLEIPRIVIEEAMKEHSLNM